MQILKSGKKRKSVLVPMLRQEKLADYSAASRIQLLKSFIFCRSLLFFQKKQELPIVYSYKFICVYIISFYANITKIRIRSYHCRFTESKPTKTVILLYKNCFNKVLQMDIFP